MRVLFIDTHYFVASFHVADEWHERAVRLETEITDCRFVTSDLVLWEVLNHFSRYGVESREQTVNIVEDILADDQIQVIEANRDLFLEGMKLYSPDSTKVIV